jgi:transposase-like protein
MTTPERSELIALEAEIARLRAANAALTVALMRISHAKPDRLDHSTDVAIIERAAHIATAALASMEPT